MSHLDDCREKLSHLLAESERIEASYQQARALYEALENGKDVDMSGIGMNLVIDGGDGIPIPMTTDRAELSGKVVQAVNFLGRAVVTTWDEIYTTAGLAKKHCDQAEAGQQEMSPAQQPPPTDQAAPTDPTVSPPPATPPRAAPGQDPAALAAVVRPRLTPVRTEPVGGGS